MHAQFITHFHSHIHTRTQEARTLYLQDLQEPCLAGPGPTSRQPWGVRADSRRWWTDPHLQLPMCRGKCPQQVPAARSPCPFIKHHAHKHALALSASQRVMLARMPLSAIKEQRATSCHLCVVQSWPEPHWYNNTYINPKYTLNPMYKRINPIYI